MAKRGKEKMLSLIVAKWPGSHLKDSGERECESTQARSKYPGLCECRPGAGNFPELTVSGGAPGVGLKISYWGRTLLQIEGL